MKVDRDYDHFISIKIGINGNDIEGSAYTQVRVSKTKKMCNVNEFENTINYDDIKSFLKSDIIRDIIMDEIKKSLDQQGGLNGWYKICNDL